MTLLFLLFLLSERIPHFPVFHFFAFAFGKYVPHRDRSARPFERMQLIAGKVEFGFPVERQVDASQCKFCATNKRKTEHIVLYCIGFSAAGSALPIIMTAGAGVEVDAAKKDFLVFFSQQRKPQFVGIDRRVQDAFCRPAIGDVLLDGEVDAVVEADTGGGFVGLTEGEVVQEGEKRDDEQACIFHRRESQA